MRRIPFAASSILTALACAATATGAQEPTWRIFGRVVESATEQPLSDVIVTVTGTGLSARTGSDGIFVVRGVAMRSISLDLRRIGYAPAVQRYRIEGGGGDVDVGMLQMFRPMELAPIVVQAEAVRRSRRLELAGFYQRQRMGFGSFIDREDLDHWQPLQFTDLIRRVRGFTIRRNPRYMKQLVGVYGPGIHAGPDLRRYLIESRRGGPGCPAAIIVDGIRTGTTNDEDIDRLIDPSVIAGIEVYAGPASLPAEFNWLGAACGAFVIWTI